MGKKIIVNGADFSENGIKSYNYVSGIYSNNDNQKFIIVNTGLPVTSLPNGEGKFKVNFRKVANYSNGVLYKCFSTSSTANPSSSALNFNDSTNLGIRTYVQISAQAQQTLPIAVNTDYELIVDIASKKIKLNGTEYNMPYSAGLELNYMTILGGNDKCYAISSFEYFNNNGKKLIDAKAILDDNNIPCFHDSVNNTNYYCVSGTPGYID